MKLNEPFLGERKTIRSPVQSFLATSIMYSVIFPLPNKCILRFDSMTIPNLTFLRHIKPAFRPTQHLYYFRLHPLVHFGVAQSMKSQSPPSPLRTTLPHTAQTGTTGIYTEIPAVSQQVLIEDHGSVARYHRWTPTELPRHERSHKSRLNRGEKGALVCCLVGREGLRRRSRWSGERRCSESTTSGNLRLDFRGRWPGDVDQRILAFRLCVSFGRRQRCFVLFRKETTNKVKAREDSFEGVIPHALAYDMSLLWVDTLVAVRVSR